MMIILLFKAHTTMLVDIFDGWNTQWYQHR